MTVDQFKCWLEHGDLKQRVAKQVSRYTEDNETEAEVEQYTEALTQPDDIDELPFPDVASEDGDIESIASWYGLNEHERYELVSRYHIGDGVNTPPPSL
jgi:hypothetical protein